jgi:hypothetical protein
LNTRQLPFEDRSVDRGSRGYVGDGRLLQHIGRFLLGLPIILLSGFVLIEGAKFCTFAELDVLDDASIRAKDYGTAAFVPWREIMGVRSEALVEIISLKATPGAPMLLDRVNADLGALLSIRPMVGHYWMLFAEARLMGGAGFPQALSALGMAELTAPKEAEVMLERVKFGLVFWEILPPGSRTRCTSNLVTIRPILDGGEIGSIKNILGSKNEEVRAEIRSRLRDQSGADASWLVQLGL